jgi:hypothetical protein
MTWRYIFNKKIHCLHCGVRQKDLDDNRHLSWCTSSTDPADGPRKKVTLVELAKR